jgi:hypothetical protein
MASTLIGVYDRQAQAERVFNELLAKGFPRSALQLSPAEDAPQGRQAALRALERTDDESTSSLSLPEFFRTLFGSVQDNESTDIYLEAVRRGAYLVIVNAEREEQRNQALEVMQRYDPVDIDERSAQWRSKGWTKYDISAPLLDEPALGHESTLYTEERPTLPVQQTQGDPKGEAASSRLPRSSVRIFQRGF